MSIGAGSRGSEVVAAGAEGEEVLSPVTMQRLAAKKKSVPMARIRVHTSLLGEEDLAVVFPFVGAEELGELREELTTE
jgi:hypothetical protein